MTRRKSPALARRTRNRSVPKKPLSSNKLATALCILLGVVTVAVYSPTFGHSFVVLDDQEYVTTNVHIRGTAWETIKWAFTSTDAANWHPLTWLSHSLDYRLFGFNASGHHVDSVLIHALNAILLFLVLVYMTRRRWPSLLVAALFALHPINVESVAWIAERKNVLSTLFFFLTIGAYGWYSRKPQWGRYVAVLGFFAMGLMAKPMLVTLPFVLLLLDYWPLERMRSSTEGQRSSSTAGSRQSLLGLILEKVPFFVLSALSSWITVKAQRGAVRTFEEFTFSTRIENAIVSYGLYLWKMIWPAHLTLYPYSVVTLAAWRWMLSAVVLAGVTIVVVVFRRRRYLPAGWFWFLGTLIPVIGLVQVGEYSMADRYAYISLIGIFVMIAWGLSDLARAKNVRGVWGTAAAIVVLAAMAGATYRQIDYWASDYDLWAHALEISESPFAHNAIAMALMNPNTEMTKEDLERFPTEPMRVDETRRHFERALELHLQSPDVALWGTARTFNNLGNLDRMQNRLDEAREHDEKALEIYRGLVQKDADAYLPYLAGALNNLGSVNRMQNKLDEARKNYEEAYKIDRQLAEENPIKNSPMLAMMLNEFGLLDASQNRMDDARGHYKEALDIERQLAEQSPAVYKPQLAMTLDNFGLLNVVQKRMDEAQQHYEEAVNIERQLVEKNSAVYLPDLVMSLSNLGRVNRIEGRIEAARACYEEAFNLLQRLVQSNNSYVAEMAQVEAALQELEQPSPSQISQARSLRNAGQHGN